MGIGPLLLRVIWSFRTGGEEGKGGEGLGLRGFGG